VSDGSGVNGDLLIITGPTACGKSHIAAEIARSIGNAVIVNADSMQVYRDIPIVTAQPDNRIMEEIEHRLYSVCEYNEKMNVVRWAKRAAATVRQSLDEGRYPIIVGGTGMYIDCLVNGISELPEISEEAREAAENLSKNNYQKLCDYVYENDAKLRDLITTDKHRQMQRAYEMLLQTGFSIRSFFEGKTVKFLDGISYEVMVINNCPRAELYERINTRFRWMVKNGAIEEVEKLLEKTGNNTDYHLFQAIGVREICSYVTGKSDYETMIETACMNSRRYAKRQITWLRKH
jgi:tRNA dimethylallyltransferase